MVSIFRDFDLADEPIRLGRILAELMPDEPEILVLLAMMLLHDSRRDAPRIVFRNTSPVRRSGSQSMGSQFENQRPDLECEAPFQLSIFFYIREGTGTRIRGYHQPEAQRRPEIEKAS